MLLMMLLEELHSSGMYFLPLLLFKYYLFHCSLNRYATLRDTASHHVNSLVTLDTVVLMLQVVGCHIAILSYFTLKELKCCVSFVRWWTKMPSWMRAFIIATLRQLIKQSGCIIITSPSFFPNPCSSLMVVKLHVMDRDAVPFVDGAHKEDKSYLKIAWTVNSTPPVCRHWILVFIKAFYSGRVHVFAERTSRQACFFFALCLNSAA